MHENKIRKPLKLFSKGRRGIRKSNRRAEFEQSTL
jgi:hypothetical protein